VSEADVWDIGICDLEFVWDLMLGILDFQTRARHAGLARSSVVRTGTASYTAAAAACYNTHTEGAFDLKRGASVVEVMTMTLEQLERKVNDLERQVAELRNELKPFRPADRTADTFGMFRDDPLFDEIVRLGREYRDQVNSEAE
jgi:hypothetical protein